MTKKIYALAVAIILAIFPLTMPQSTNVFAQTQNPTVSAQREFEDTVAEQIKALDLENLNNFFQEYCTSDALGLFGTSSIAEKLQKIVGGDFGADTSTVLSAIASVLLQEVVSFLPLISSIIAIAVLASLLKELSTSTSVANIVHFVCFGVIIVLIMTAVTKMIALSQSAMFLLDAQMEAVFPILLTLLTATGGTASVAVYQPAVALLTTGVSKIFSLILLPLFVFSVIFTIISHISPNIRLTRFAGFLFTLFKWIVGIVFTVFMAFLAIKGITAGSIDTVSFKTARYSLSTYVPIVGGYLSEGLNLILASCVVIKNAVGTCGLFILASSVFVPIVQLVLFRLVLKFTGACLEPLSDNRISNFVSDLAKVFIMPIVMILAVAFMYVVFVGLVMCTNIGI